MTLSLTQNVFAVAPNVPASFAAIGGTAPYVYSVIAGGSGGTINSSTGWYSAPAFYSSDANRRYDTIQVVDFLGATALAQILVGSVISLFCDILEKEMNLSNGRVYFWDQKINEPTDSNLFIAVSNPISRPYANINRIINGVEFQTCNYFATLDADIISRSADARDRKGEIVLALNSTYSEQQQEINSFQIAKITAPFPCLSIIDGAAIPYRYKISVNILYAEAKSKAIPYFNTFAQPTVYTNP
jgi:hypothetical protein